MSEIHFDEQVDITDVVCPVTFVKAKVALEEMDEGQVLAVKMNDGEPVQNVPRSIKEEGHQILKLDTNDEGIYTLLVEQVGEKSYVQEVKGIKKENPRVYLKNTF